MNVNKQPIVYPDAIFHSYKLYTTLPVKKITSTGIRIVCVRSSYAYSNYRAPVEVNERHTENFVSQTSK